MVFLWVCMGNEEIIQHKNLTPHHLVKAKPCIYICYLETAKIISNIYIAWKFFFHFPFGKKKLRHWSIWCFSKKLMVAKLLLKSFPQDVCVCVCLGCVYFCVSVCVCVVCIWGVCVCVVCLECARVSVFVCV